MRQFSSIAAAISLLACASARAELVVFHNIGGMFEWDITLPNDGEIGQFLDITQGPSQSGAESPLGIRYDDDYPLTRSSEGFERLRGSTNARIASVGFVPYPDWQDEYYVNFAVTYNVGDLVGPGPSFTSGGDLRIYFWDDQAPDQWIGDSQPPQSNVFVGVELSMDDGVHYGWIELAPVYRTVPGGLLWERFEAASWGYETQAGVAAAVVPAPGGAAIIGCAGLASLRRRR